jgi:hypothetical protein
MLEFSTTAGGAALDGPYHPAGEDWPRQVRPDALPRLVAAEIAGPDPAGLAAHWAAIFRVKPADGPAIRLEHGRIDVIPGDAERLDGVRLAVADPAATRAVAAARGLLRDGAIWLCGVRVTLEQAG